MKAKETYLLHKNFEHGTSIRVLNKQPHKWMVAQKKTMVSWYKLIGDAPSPATKQLLHTSYVVTMGCGDAPVPVAGIL